MVRHLTRCALLLLLAVAAAACGDPVPTSLAGPRIEVPLGQEIPGLREPQFGGGGGGGVALAGEELAEVTEAAPPGLRVTTIQIARLPQEVRDALGLSENRLSRRGPGLLTLPIAQINPDLGMYYLVVPVVNDGPAPVRNLKARADFLDARGVVVWSETQPVTHFPTRLGLNPPSLPNDRRVPPGELGEGTSGFGLYYFAGNVGIFTFSVPDVAVARRVRDWRLTFLVSTT